MENCCIALQLPDGVHFYAGIGETKTETKKGVFQIRGNLWTPDKKQALVFPAGQAKEIRDWLSRDSPTCYLETAD